MDKSNKIKTNSPIFWVGSLVSGMAINQLLRVNCSAHPLVIVSYGLIVGLLAVGIGIILLKKMGKAMVLYLRLVLCGERISSNSIFHLCPFEGPY